jgi:hypothetical protein|uniref:hypothetical protein n=1 Tax=uncultured Sphingomonas sp. TaxID=158754 RepID=UPI0035C9F183
MEDRIRSELSVVTGLYTIMPISGRPSTAKVENLEFQQTKFRVPDSFDPVAMGDDVVCALQP